MASIPYRATSCHPSQTALPETSTSEPDPTLVEQFYAEAKRQIVKGDYLRRKWLPLYGPRFYSLIKALRAHCSYEIKAGEAMCYPSETTLARACGVSRRTILYWLVRVKAGEEQKGQKAGDFCHPRHGEALQRFLRIMPKTRYDPVGQRSVKTTNRYFIRMDDPAVPEDEPLIWAKARELAAQHLASQRQEQEHTVRQQEFERRAAQAASSSEAVCTLNNAQILHTQQCAKTAQNRLFSPPLLNTDTHRSPQERDAPLVMATRISQAEINTQKNRTQEHERDEHRATSTSKSNVASAQPREDLFRHAVPLDEGEERRREEREAAMEAAYDAAGGVVRSLLEEFGDTNVRAGTAKALNALVAAGAPAEHMTALAYLARDRVRTFVLRGGRILDTQVGFYLTTLCNLAKEARRKGWQLEQIAAADRRRHERMIRHQGLPMPQIEVQERPPHCPARRSTRPTPEEAEALVIALGQRGEAYAEVQAQVRQMEERKQAREARQQVVRQQAQLYQRLDQAEQDLKTYPEGSLAWERARREQQKLQRQLAALRSQQNP
jgi:hypothetical protein